MEKKILPRIPMKIIWIPGQTCWGKMAQNSYVILINTVNYRSIKSNIAVSLT